MVATPIIYAGLETRAVDGRAVGDGTHVYGDGGGGLYREVGDEGGDERWRYGFQ